MERPQTKPSETERALMKQEKREDYAANRQRVIRHLQKRGLSNAAIAGIVGNIDVETGGSFDHTLRQTVSGRASDPRTIESGGYGLFQFDDYAKNTGHESWYKGYLKDKGKKDSPEAQLDYLLDMVMAGADKQDPNFKYAKKMGETNASTLKAYLTTNTNPSQIADAITDRFEKPGSPHSARRRASAQETFEELAPRDRADMDMDAQYINQSGEIRDTDTDVPIVDVPDEKSTYEKIKPYIPILRHFNEGGMALEKQMELFEDGGLKDEGGTTDPVSGNDVPPGSTQEEVRDDIPAQLSEGEFVFPADVVRFIGLEKLMQMRQQAKMGLQMMEDMGQMGNSDEATMPDDIPFDLSDLDMDDDLEYNVGGFVPGQPNQFGIAGTQQSAFTGGVGGYTPYQMPQYSQTPMAQTYTPVQQQFVPVQPVPTTLPTPQEFLPETPTDPEVTTKEYINPETGERRVITFVGGQPTIGIPEGFIPMEEYEKTQPPATKVAPTTTPTTRVVDRDDSDDDRRREEEEEEMFGPGGGRLGIAGETYGVSFDMPEGFMPGAMGVAGTAFGLLSGKPVPSGVTVNFQRGKDKFKLTGDEYNRLKTSIDESGANSPETTSLLANIKQDALKREANKRVAEQERIARETREQLKKAQQLSRDDSERDEIFDRIIEQKIKEATKEVAADTGYDEDLGSAPTAPSTQRQSDSGGASSGGRTGSSSTDWSKPDSSASVGSQSDYDKMYGNQGGLASKPKPKAKKMKRDGLASKK